VSPTAAPLIPASERQDTKQEDATLDMFDKVPHQKQYGNDC
jgi:hypothetical protein